MVAQLKLSVRKVMVLVGNVFFNSIQDSFTFVIPTIPKENTAV